MKTLALNLTLLLMVLLTTGPANSKAKPFVICVDNISKACGVAVGPLRQDG